MANGGRSEADVEKEFLRLKTLAENKYNAGNLKSAFKYAKRAHRLSPTVDGAAEMLTAFKILIIVANTSSTTPKYYNILQVEPFSHINAIKRQYKKLALSLHPDKNPFVASEDAFKLVSEAFCVLSDKIKKKDYDMKLRVAMQAMMEAERGGVDVGEELEAFWTACSTSRLLHKFERKYLGHDLICPSCKKSFKAAEIFNSLVTDQSEKSQARVGDRIWMQSGLKRKMGSVEEILERSELMSEQMTLKEVQKLRYVNQNVKTGNGSKAFDRLNGKRAKTPDETLTLAEMQVLAKKKAKDQRSKLKSEEQRDEEEEEDEDYEKFNENGFYLNEASKMNPKITRRESKKRDLEIMTVEDSDFYDFDKGRVEKSFKKGQIWAMYDDDDGMPRIYCLVDETVSAYPFEVNISWLDFQNNGDQEIISWEKMGFHASCGRFVVSKKASVRSLNVFSHVVDCERVAKEMYRVYPKKGSVWAVYKDKKFDSGRRNVLVKEWRGYDIVVFLTTFSEVHGLSMAYLEKVEGFRTVFKRREIGCHAIRWLEKDDFRMFSHQIPARKLSGVEAPELPKDCWELDPASLPSELLAGGTRV